MYDTAASGEWSRIEPLLQQHGPGLATADLSRDNRGVTALHVIALFASDLPASAESIQHLATIETVNIDARGGIYGCTPLQGASACGNVHQVRALLRCGAIADTKDYDGDTPTSHCCKAEDADNINRTTILSLLKNPPRTYKQELIDKRNMLAMILNKCISIGTKQDINQMLIGIGY
jgi:ankyrin repeat protein